MSKNLMIVESPGKADMIEKYLGKDFHVMASRGHIRDIEGVGKNSMGVDFNNSYAPNYVIDKDKIALVESLRKEAQKADMVWFASDPDREGEAIAWHIYDVLQLPDNKVCRVTFNDVTKETVLEAVKHPRGIDMNIVNAQQARRVIDRIVGFELSPVLWKKVTTGLSAGRVQSVVVRMVVEREREIESFMSTSNYRLTAEFVGQTPEGEAVTFKAELNHRFATKQEALAFLQTCQAQEFAISSVTHKPGRRSPAPPFTTSSLQQEAVRKLHFTVSKTMRLAQSLYEAGHITYMRTDSENLSSLAINTAKTVIVGEFGDKYHQARQYKTSTKGAQEAHEAIRPTYMNAVSAGSNNDERRLYDLIRKRAMASQMADALTDTTRIEVSMNQSPYLWVANYSVITFDGFMRVYTQSADDELSSQATPLSANLSEGGCRMSQAVAQESFTKAPTRYDEGTLILQMKTMGIGRPSTYAPVVETIQTRGYVEKSNVVGVPREYNVLTLKGGKIQDVVKTEMVGADSGKLVPTDLGRITNDFLLEQFPEIMSYEFTAKEEEHFDTIASGNANWVEVVDAFYHTFHPLIGQVPAGKMAARILGTDPATGEPVLARISKNGPCVQLGNSDVEKPRFVSIPKGVSIFTITLEEALALFQRALPQSLGEWEGEEIVVGEGKYGPYLRYKSGFTSLPKSFDPYTITLEQAIAVLEQQQQQQLPIHVFGDIQVLNGRYGAYIKTSQGNYKLPKGTDVASLTEEECQKIIASSTPTSAAKSRYKSKK